MSVMSVMSDLLDRAAEREQDLHRRLCDAAAPCGRLAYLFSDSYLGTDDDRVIITRREVEHLYAALGLGDIDWCNGSRIPDVQHTDRDRQALEDAGLDPASTQPRERSVPCSRCGKPTWNHGGGCDLHYLPPAACIGRVA